MPIFNRKNPLQLKAVSRPAPSAGSGTAASDFSASVSLRHTTVLLLCFLFYYFPAETSTFTSEDGRGIHFRNKTRITVSTMLLFSTSAKS
jgi:hypothetical protein